MSDDQAYLNVAFMACARFADLCDPQPVNDGSEEVGSEFHFSVDVRADLIAEKWREAVDTLAVAVNAEGERRAFRRLEQPYGATFCSGTSLPRFIVMYVPPTVDEAGELVPGYLSARFDAAGVSYPAK